jgi:competence ComEA-like helix-hairpin-helix protein
MKFKDFSNKIGFTKTEFNVLLILIFVFLFGLSLKIIRKDKYSPVSDNYIDKDRVFYLSSGRVLTNNSSFSKEKVNSDYKQYILEINKQSKKYIAKSPIINPININSAKIDEFIKLPGIGEKTAEKILELRIKKGKFNSIEELKEVKGIGDSKFEKFKKFIIVE